MNENQVYNWLLEYAWLGTEDQKRRTVDCIMSQDEWKDLDVVSDQFDDIVAESGEAPGISGQEWALSALYECHHGPHLSTCWFGDERDRSPHHPSREEQCN